MAKKGKTSTAAAQAAAQLGTNVGTAIANAQLGMVNQKTPYGSQTFSQDGEFSFTGPDGQTYSMPRYSMEQTLSPMQQSIMANAQGATQAYTDRAYRLATGGPFTLGPDNVSAQTLQTGVGNLPGLATSFSSAGPITRSYGDEAGYAESRQKVEDALMSRLNPQLDRDRSSLETRLANQGVRVGSDAYTRAMSDFGQQSNDARYGAILNAGQEQNRLAALDAQRATFENQAQAQAYGQNQSSAAFGNQALQQQFANQIAEGQFANQAKTQNFQNALQLRAANDQRALTERNQPFNELAAIQSGGQIAMPSFQGYSPTQMPNIDIAGLMASENASAQQQRQNLWGGLLGFGSNLILSDRRAKTDIRKIGKADNGLGLYSYRYKADPRGTTHVGVMAQEAERKKPTSVVTGPDGFKRVDYGALFNAAKKEVA